MRKKLAIQGHSTRGNEVIKLLGIMGGHNGSHLLGNKSDSAYFIADSGDIGCRDTNILTNYFTLEDFFEKYPFKVGDKVTDKADGCPGIISEMKWDADVSDMKYCVVFGNGIDFGWFTNDSIELCKENNNLDETKVESTGFMQLGKTFAVIFNDANYEDEVELQLGNYEIVVRDCKTYAVLKKPKYPTTYVECEKILGLEGSIIEGCLGYEYKRLNAFQKLLMCRDAYWKIAGEQMGLDKP